MSVLYEGEEVNLYDAETGKPAANLVTTKEEEALEQMYYDAQELKIMRESKGWKLVEKFLADAIEDYTRKMVWSTDLNLTCRLQEAVKSYSNVLMFIDDRILEGHEFLKRKQALELEANLKGKNNE